MEVVQLIIPAGQGIPTYEAQGELILHCLEGRVSISVRGMQHDLNSGQLLYLTTNQPFSVRGVENASLLVTFVAARQGSQVELLGD